MGTASARRRQKSLLITQGSTIFADCITRGDIDSAAKISYWTALESGGEKGIIDSLNDANSFAERISKRRGL